MKNSKNTAFSLITTATIAAAAGVAAASSHPPGYTWGRANCGPGVNETQNACTLCCRSAGTNGTIDPGDVSGCEQMCRESTFVDHQTTLLWLIGWLAYV